MEVAVPDGLAFGRAVSVHPLRGQSAGLSMKAAVARRLLP